MFPTDNVWNLPVDALPLDPNSAVYVNTIGTNKFAHPDFGSGTYNGSPLGIPFTNVAGTQQLVGVTFYYAGESDPGPYPIPPDAPIEGGPNSTGDRHVFVLDRDNCLLYEMFDSHPQVDGSWQAGSGAIFDLKTNDLRPAGWTSADAAGLPILPGLVRYDEVAAGEIRHAIRFTAPQTRRQYIWPARHFASSLTGSQYPPMGQRFRLKADYDIAGFAPDVQVILRALKKYGMILADNGSAWFLSGAPDERWNNDTLHQLQQVKGSAFEAVDESALMVDPDSAQVNTNAVPPISDAPVIVAGPGITNALVQTEHLAVVESGVLATLRVDAIDPGNDPLSYQWVFGDGTSSGWLTTNVTAHVYAAVTNCQSYITSVTVSNSHDSTSGNLTVAVADQLNVTKLQTKLNFAKPNADSCSVSATLAPCAGFSVTNKVVVVDVGGAQVLFTLDAKGRGLATPHSCRVTYNKKTSRWTVAAKLKNGSWQVPWDVHGLQNLTIPKPGNPVTMPVVLVVDAAAFAGDVMLTYTATQQKSGTATLPKVR